jgi:nicotinate dehydrogenase subunit B
VLAGAFGAAAALAGALLHGPPAFAPIARPDPAAYSGATIARGASLAAVGGCVYCHTADSGVALAGGRPFETLYGVLYSTNLTPDETTGVGAWSYEAFARAMRQGVSRDGRYLFPAFPYTSFARTSEADLQALYAWTMAQTPISQPNRSQALKAPFGWRPLMAAWNAMFHRPEPLPAARGDLFGRGKYLVEGLGHCSACHSPRNPLGAEMAGDAHFSGAMVDGFWAPPLNQSSPAPIPWSEGAYYDYLRTGYSALHGAAGGKMAEVVANLKGAPDEDISAMAHYLASYSRPAPMAGAELKSELEAASLARAKNPEYLAGARIYQGACAVCHEPGQGVAMFGVKPSLAVATAIQAATPEATLRSILEGSTSTALPELGAMPGFAAHFDDAQLVDLLDYLRARFAPEKPGWRDGAVVSGRLRRSLGSARGG